MIKVLIVDDSRVTREVTKVYLIAKDVTVMDARDGEDALRAIRADKPDIVIADMQMPRLDGPGLCQSIGADPALADIPVLILTSNLDPRSGERCLKAGAKEILFKPVQPAHLLASMKRHLGERWP